MKCDKLTTKMSLCWGAAIICAAMFDAPEFFTLILLPILAFTSIANVKKQSYGSYFQNTLAVVCIDKDV